MVDEIVRTCSKCKKNGTTYVLHGSNILGLEFMLSSGD